MSTSRSEPNRSKLKMILTSKKFIISAVVITLVTIAIVVGVVWILKTPFINFKKVFHTYKEDNSTKYILVWTDNPHDVQSIFDENSNEGFQKDYFKYRNCPKSNCVLTADRKLLEREEEFDAIVFYTNKRFKVAPLPIKRVHKQKYVLAIQEPLNQIPADVRAANAAFNWTMSYRIDSDIVWHHKSVLDKEINMVIAPAKVPSWKTPEENFSNANFLNTVQLKPKLAAAYVTNCDTSLKSNQLIAALRKNISIDIFGECGEQKCPNKQDCFSQIEQNYKFFLAFENDLCTDYVSESFYDILNRTIIPVVYGGADYGRFAPPKSYIDANKFGNSTALADFLIDLDHHPDQYVQYFWWTKHYTVVETTKQSLCSLCHKLNNWSLESKTEIYSDVVGWFDSCATTSPIKF